MPGSGGNDVLHAAAPFWRRMAAIVYDAFLLAGLLVLASALVTLPVGLGLGREAADAVFRSATFRWAFFAYCVAVVAIFHRWFWTHGGQTLGMKSWRIRVVRDDGSALRAADALRRWLTALLSWMPGGLGFLWSLVDRDGRAWHDRLSATRLVLVPRRPRAG